MNFIKPDNVILNNISDQRNVIITAEKLTTITKINICNLSDDNSGIRIFLKQIKNLEVDTPKEAFVLRNLLLERNVSKDLITFLGNKIHLNNGDSLIIYSAGYSQLFDCIVDFYEYNEVIDGTPC